MLSVFEIIEDMCAGQYADEKRNAGSWSKLPQQLLLVDYVLYRNVCPLGHKLQKHDNFFKHYTPSIRATSIQSRQSFGTNFINSGMG
jgi:hypothetical protein